MAKQHPEINDELAGWIRAQHVFFVATAPLAAAGHINCSPKGGDAFRILDPVTVAYHDYTGSGAETAAHIQENQRIVIMFCSFKGPPKIVRLHGRGRIIPPGHPEFAALSRLFPPNPGTRSMVHVAVTRISDSCGYGVPVYDFQGQRDTLDKWAVNHGPEKLDLYRATRNRESIDGLAAFIPKGS